MSDSTRSDHILIWMPPSSRLVVVRGQGSRRSCRGWRFALWIRNKICQLTSRFSSTNRIKVEYRFKSFATYIAYVTH